MLCPKYLKKLERQKKKQEEELEKMYQEFLSQNDYDKIIKEDWKVVLYKKVAEFII